MSARALVIAAIVCMSQRVWCAEQKEGLMDLLLRRSGVDLKNPEAGAAKQIGGGPPSPAVPEQEPGQDIDRAKRSATGEGAKSHARRGIGVDNRALRIREAFRSLSEDELLERAVEGVRYVRAAAGEQAPPSVDANVAQLRNVLEWAERMQGHSQALRAVLSELLRRKLGGRNLAAVKHVMDPDDPLDALVLALLRRGGDLPKATVSGGLGGSHLRNSIGMEFVHIPAGTFMMGSERGGSDEKPVHQVTISRPFYMGKHEVTQAQFKQIMGKNPSRFSGPDKPVDKVTWYQAGEFCMRLTAKEGHRYRLPTDAQWEYACRAGTKTRYSFGDDEGEVGVYAWFDGNSGKSTHAVGKKRPNPWGLYDMHGNVWEWCRDGKRSYTSSKMVDPVGPSSGSRVLRGGAWDDGPGDVRSAARAGIGPAFRRNPRGFRVVLSLSSR